MNSLLFYCRPGFEKECSQEILQATKIKGLTGFIKAKPQSGYIIYELYQEIKNLDQVQQIRFNELIFPRQIIFTSGLMKDIPVSDRVSPLLEEFQTLPPCCQLFIEFPDTNEGKSLSGFCKKFHTPMVKSLENKALLKKNSNSIYRAHLFFLDSSNAYPGVSRIDNSSPWHSGIPRLKFPKSAPSRSTLKLEEAWKTFFQNEDETIHLNRKMSAVDLGASPGGWTWQFVQRFIHVTAVDNGPMQAELMDSGLVTHNRTDAFTYKPEKPVTWMVCDVVESPRRIAKLVSQWLSKGWCRYCIFNLKLPMKKRYQETLACKTLISDTLDKANIDYEFQLKQLYHDREEVTGYIRVLGENQL